MLPSLIRKLSNYWKCRNILLFNVIQLIWAANFKSKKISSLIGFTQKIIVNCQIFDYFHFTDVMIWHYASVYIHTEFNRHNVRVQNGIEIAVYRSITPLFSLLLCVNRSRHLSLLLQLVGNFHLSYASSQWGISRLII